MSIKCFVGSIVFIKISGTKKEKNSSIADNYHFQHHTPVNLASGILMEYSSDRVVVSFGF